MAQIYGPGNPADPLHQMAWWTGSQSFNMPDEFLPMTVQSGTSFHPTDCNGNRCKVELCAEGDPDALGTASGAYFIDARLTQYDANGVSKQTHWRSATATDRSDFVGLDVGDWYANGTCNGEDGSFTEYSHAVHFEWPTGAGQWPDDSCEFLGTCP